MILVVQRHQEAHLGEVWAAEGAPLVLHRWLRARIPAGRGTWCLGKQCLELDNREQRGHKGRSCMKLVWGWWRYYCYYYKALLGSHSSWPDRVPPNGPINPGHKE